MNTRITDALGRTSPSERRLLALLGVAILAAGPVFASNMMQEASVRRDEVQAELDRMRQVAKRSQAGAGGELAAARNDVRDWSWQAESIEVGKVLVQDRVTDLAKKAGLANLEVRLAEKTEPAGDVQLVGLDVLADFSWAGFSKFVAAMDETGKGFIIDGVQMTDADKSRLKVSMRALVSTASATAVRSPQ